MLFQVSNHSAVCLLLDKRYSEKERIHEEFQNFGIDVGFYVVGDGTELSRERYSRINTVPPEREGYPAWMKRPNSYNAFESFKDIVFGAMNDGVENLLLIEDDVVLAENFGLVLNLAWKQLLAHDSAWEMFYLGANHTFSRTKQVDSNLLRLNGSGCWHCVCLRSSIFKTILNFPADNPIDNMAAKLIHPRGHSYAAWPNVALTKSGFSYCEGRDVDYGHFWNNKGC